MQTIAEMPEFIRRAAKILGQAERQALIDHLAESPKAGFLFRARAVSVSFGGHVKALGKVAAFVLSTFFTMSRCRCIC